MEKVEIKHFKVLQLPISCNPDSIYYVLDSIKNRVKTFITDSSGIPIPLIDLTGMGIVQSVTGTAVTGTITNPEIDIVNFVSSELGNLVKLSSQDGKLKVNKITSPDLSLDIVDTPSELQIEIANSLLEKINNALQPEDISQYTDEQAQDAIGNIIADTTTIDLVYNDITPSISASVKPNSITNSELSVGVNSSLSLANTSVQPLNIQNFFNKLLDDTDDIVEGVTKKFTTTAEKNFWNVKQENLVSGTNIKTIEGQSILGSGNIDLTKVDVGLSNVDNTSDVNKPVAISVQNALDLKEDKSNKNISNGYAGLDSGGKINPLQLPALAITDTFVVNSQAEMLALSVEIGDVAVRTDINKSFILRVGNPTVLSNWQELLTPVSVDQSIIDGSSNAVSGNAVFDGLTLKENAVNKQNSLVVDGIGVKYPTVDAINSEVVKLLGVQTINGQKTFRTNSPLGLFVDVDQNAGNVGINIEQRSNGGATTGLKATNFNAGDAVYISNQSTGLGLKIDNFSSGNVIVSNSVGVASSGLNYVGQNDGVNTFMVNKFGSINASSFIKNSATSTNLLLAGGADITQASLPVSTATQTALNLKQNTISGTANVIPKFGTGGLVASQLFDNGTNVGIGTISPLRKLHILETSDNPQLIIEGNVSSSVNRAFVKVFNDAITFGSATNTGVPFKTTFSINAISGVMSILEDTGWAINKKAFFGGSGNAYIYSPTANNLEAFGFTSSIFGTNDSSIKINATGLAYHQDSMGTGTAVFSVRDASGNTLVKTVVDNSVDALQVNGTVSASPATLSNQVVVKSQLDALTPSIQLKDFFVDANNVGTTETDLYSYTTLANRLNATGEKIVAVYGGELKDATASSQLKVYFAGQVIGDTGVLTMSVAGAFVINVSIIRTGASTARSILNISTPGASTSAYTKYTSLTGLTFSNTNILKITGTSGGATGGNDDITATYGNIQWQPAAI